MRNIVIPVLLLISGYTSSQAQTAEQVEELYDNFSQVRLGSNYASIISAGEKLMTMLDKFGPNRKTFITFYLANAYENDGQIEKAVPLYLKVIQAEPHYYVPYRAMGYYYLKLGNQIADKLNGSKDANKRKKLEIEYRDMRAKALAYLEKDYACDQFEGSLKTIKWLMEVVGEQAKPDEFEQRIAKLSENCVTLLRDYEQ